MSIDSNVATIIVAVIVGAGTIIGARLSAASGISEAAMKLVAPLKDRIEELEKELKPLRPLPDRVKRLEAENKEFRKGVPILIKQLEEARLKPRWIPAPELSETGDD